MKINFFDKLFILFILFALFTVGYHIGKERSEDGSVTFALSIAPEEEMNGAFFETEGYIDGKYKIYGVRYEDGVYVFMCDGLIGPLGFLAGGAKYLAKNQPIKIWGEYSLIVGRITDMEKYR